MHRVSFAAGEPIYREGEASDLAFLIVDGEVSMLRAGILMTSGKGKLIGFSALFDRPYGSTATAVTACRLLAFTRKEFRNLIRSNPEEALAIIEGMMDLIGRVADALEEKAAEIRRG